MKLLTFVFLSITAFAQQDRPWTISPEWLQDGPAVYLAKGPEIWTYTSLALHSTGEPASAHDLALKKIKEYSDYMSINVYGSGPVMASRYVFGGSQPTQEFTVAPDGKLTLINITAEDALLAIVGEQLHESLERNKKQDVEEAAREKERKAHPPSRLKSGKKTFKVSSVPSIGGNPHILGQTNCKAETIKILMSDGAKREGVFHEMMHVASNCDESIHKAIYELQKPMLKMLQDNPDMVRYLVGTPDWIGGTGLLIPQPQGYSPVQTERMPSPDDPAWGLGAQRIPLPCTPEADEGCTLFRFTTVKAKPSITCNGVVINGGCYVTPPAQDYIVPIDVPPVEEEYGPLGLSGCDDGHCWFRELREGESTLGETPHRQTRSTCADKSRFLMTSEDGKRHCIRF